MSAQHTPGPWLTQPTELEGDLPGVGIIGDNLGGLVGMALPWPTEIDSGEFTRVEANARLIAAAPELYDALEALMAYDGARGTYDASKAFEAKEAAERVLAKARGMA